MCLCLTHIRWNTSLFTIHQFAWDSSRFYHLEYAARNCAHFKESGWLLSLIGVRILYDLTFCLTLSLRSGLFIVQSGNGQLAFEFITDSDQAASTTSTLGLNCCLPLWHMQADFFLQNRCVLQYLCIYDAIGTKGYLISERIVFKTLVSLLHFKIVAFNGILSIFMIVDVVIFDLIIWCSNLWCYWH